MMWGVSKNKNLNLKSKSLVDYMDKVKKRENVNLKPSRKSLNRARCLNQTKFNVFQPNQQSINCR